MSDPEALLREAAKKESYTGFFGFGSNSKLDEAAELYQQAGNAFKLGKKLSEAGNAFILQANVLIKAGEKDEAATAYLNASKSFKKSNPKESLDALHKAVQILSEKGRFQSAANNQKIIAEMYEVDFEDFEKAMHAYEQAADWYLGEDSNAQSSACQLKAAALAAQLEQYGKAVEKFESVAAASLDNNLTKWSVRDYLLKAGICLLCDQDHIKARQSFERYKGMDATFSGTRECKLLEDLLDAVEEGDVEQYTNTIVDFDKMTKLDNWKTTLLLRVKKTFSDPENMDFT